MFLSALYSIGMDAKSITVQEAARRLKVSRERIHQWIRDGRLPAGWFGRQRTVNPADLAKIEQLPMGRPRKKANL